MAPARGAHVGQLWGQGDGTRGARPGGCQTLEPQGLGDSERSKMGTLGLPFHLHSDQRCGPSPARCTLLLRTGFAFRWKVI